jgi:hypothetical protein
MWGPGICLGQPRQVIKEGTSELLVKLTQKSEEEEELDPAGIQDGKGKKNSFKKNKNRRKLLSTSMAPVI